MTLKECFGKTVLKWTNMSSDLLNSFLLNWIGFPVCRLIYLNDLPSIRDFQTLFYREINWVTLKESLMHSASSCTVLWICFPSFSPHLCVWSWHLLLCVAGSVEVSRRSPVASWLCAMLYCFGSYILADIMLGSSPLDYFQHNSHILLASAVWWENPPKDVHDSGGVIF